MASESTPAQSKKERNPTEKENYDKELARNNEVVLMIQIWRILNYHFARPTDERPEAFLRVVYGTPSYNSHIFERPELFCQVVHKYGEERPDVGQGDDYVLWKVIASHAKLMEVYVQLTHASNTDEQIIKGDFLESIDMLSKQWQKLSARAQKTDKHMVGQLIKLNGIFKSMAESDMVDNLTPDGLASAIEKWSSAFSGQVSGQITALQPISEILTGWLIKKGQANGQGSNGSDPVKLLLETVEAEKRQGFGLERWTIQALCRRHRLLSTIPQMSAEDGS